MEGGCRVEMLSLPHIKSSSSFIRHSVNLQSMGLLLSEYAQALLSMPLSIKHRTEHEHVTAGGILHSLSPHACMSQITTLSHFNESKLPENIFTVLNVIVNSNLVIFDNDSPTENLLRPIIGGKREKQKALQETARITCMYRSPDLLVGQAQCELMIGTESELRGLENKVKNLSELTSFPAFLVRNNKEIKPFAFGDELLCSDLRLKMSLEQLFYQYDSFHLRLSQACDFFNLTCDFISCGMNQGSKTLEEMDKFANCLLSSTKSKSFQSSGERQRRDLHIFSSLLQSLGLVKSASQISLEHFNQVSKHNFQQLKNNQLGLEQALLDQSKDLHTVLKKEGEELENVYDRVSMLSSHMHLLNRVNHAREQILSSHTAFGSAFEKMTMNLEILLEMAMSPLSQQQNGVFCRHSECVDSRSLIIRKEGEELIVAARLLEIESVAAGRVSCPLMQLGGKVYVHGMLDKIVYQKHNIYYSQEGNKEVTSSCLKSGLNCPEGVREVESRDLLLDSLYMFLQGDTFKIQCIKELQLINVKGNYTCSLNPIQVEPPFVIVGPGINHLVETHNIHVYVSLPREVKAFERDAFHRKRMPNVPGYSGVHLIKDWETNNFEPFHNLVHGVITFTPLSALLLICCCTCCCVKFPALRIHLWTAVKKCWNIVIECCGKLSSQNNQPCVDTPLAGASAPIEAESCAPSLPPIREAQPFLSQSGSGYNQGFYQGRGPGAANVQYNNMNEPMVTVNLPQRSQQNLQNPDFLATRVFSDSMKKLNDKIISSGESLARLGKKIEK